MADRQRPADLLPQSLFGIRDSQTVFGVNDFGGVRYFRKEAFAYWIWWFYALAAQESLEIEEENEIEAERLSNLFQIVETWKQRAEDSGYKLEEFLEPKPEKKKTAKTPSVPKKVSAKK